LVWLGLCRRRRGTGMCLVPVLATPWSWIVQFRSSSCEAWFLRDLSFRCVCVCLSSLLQAADIKVLGALTRDDLRKLCGGSFPEWISFPQFEQVGSTSTTKLSAPLAFSSAILVWCFMSVVSCL
jgi:hypothetical protein